MDKKKLHEMFETIKNNITPEQLIEYRAISVLASIVGDVVLTEDAAVEKLVDRFKEVDDGSGISLNKDAILKQIKKDKLIDFLVDKKFITIENNEYKIYGKGLIVGWIAYLQLMANSTMSEETTSKVGLGIYYMCSEILNYTIEINNIVPTDICIKLKELMEKQIVNNKQETVH